MGTSAAKGIHYLKGRLVKGPSGGGAVIFGSFPYGGTELGTIQRGVFKIAEAAVPVQTAEEFGGIVTEVGYMGQNAALVAVLRDWDKDALSTIFPDAIEGSTSQERVIRVGVDGAFTAEPGKLLSDLSIDLLFCPDAEDQHEFIYLYNAVPVPIEGAEIGLSPSVEFSIPVAFRALPNANGKQFMMGKKVDIVLTA